LAKIIFAKRTLSKPYPQLFLRGEELPFELNLVILLLKWFYVIILISWTSLFTFVLFFS